MPRRTVERRLHWAAYLWPGLPHLWNEGSWAGLALALGFTVLLNASVLSVAVWPEWLPERVKLACGLTTALVWLAALVETRGELRRQAARRLAAAQESRDDASPDELEEQHDGSAPREQPGAVVDELFQQAQRHYLAGNWLETERTLNELLRRDRNDIEGQLLLASLRRTTGETRGARSLIERLARRADAQGWLFEIRDEQSRLDDVKTRGQEPPSDYPAARSEDAGDDLAAGRAA